MVVQKPFDYKPLMLTMQLSHTESTVGGGEEFEPPSVPTTKQYKKCAPSSEDGRGALPSNYARGVRHHNSSGRFPLYDLDKVVKTVWIPDRAVDRITRCLSITQDAIAVNPDDIWLIAVPFVRVQRR